MMTTIAIPAISPSLFPTLKRCQRLQRQAKRATDLCPDVLLGPVDPPVGSVPVDVPASPGMPVGRGPTVDERVTVDVLSTEM